MVLGMSLSTFTSVHVAISLIGIVSGFIVMSGFLVGKRLDAWTGLFLSTTILTSATGYLFPFEHLLPSHILGLLSLIALAIAVLARYAKHMTGPWRVVYVVTACIALYFNVFVLVVQSFLKVPSLHQLAPKGSEPPFAIAQGTVLIVFVALTTFAVKKFHPEPAYAA
jgi:hypothetical protein